MHCAQVGEKTLDNFLDKNDVKDLILELKSLKEINAVGIALTETEVDVLKGKKPGLKIRYRTETFKKVPKDEEIDVIIFDTYIVFENDFFFNGFVQTCPKYIQNCVKVVNPK